VHARDVEIARYEQCYQNRRYAMGKKRKCAAEQVLKGLDRGSLLDVGAGRGELRLISKSLGFDYRGVEPVSYLANEDIITGIATALPFADQSFDIVACLDVLEHLIEVDIRPSLEEFQRVARRYVFLTASEKPSTFGSPGGKDLHISKRPRAQWEAMFDDVFVGSKINFLGTIGVCPGWLVEL
jgi:SAM-dependent methyltransferase